MTAREKFQRGQRVRLSEYGRERFPSLRDGAVVVGFGRKENVVCLLRDGVKTRDSFYMDFWEPEEASEQTVISGRIRPLSVGAVAKCSPYCESSPREKTS